MDNSIHITFLGGLGEIGRNCAAIESKGKIVVLDCGQLFADGQPGVDAILPDFDWLVERSEDIEACIITHAHEDHIGGLPYLLRDLQTPIYGSRFTLGMIKAKLQNANVSLPDLRAIGDNEVHQIGPFECEFLPVTHSTPSGLMTIFRTDQGLILHSSDFKLDSDPVDGRVTDMGRISELANNEGIRLLLADSTNADSAGMSSSESEIGPVLKKVFEENSGRRIIIGAFSSHIHRVQQIFDAAVQTNRKLVVLGPSMIRNVALARELGLLRISDKMLATEKELKNLKAGQVCVVCTGSQGESRAALARMADGRHGALEIGKKDTVIFSSHPIPGNEASVFKLHNKLARMGALIVHSGHLKVHTTGHGKAGELMALHESANPELFIPVHGEYMHLVAHQEIAIKRGMNSEKILRCIDGDRVCLDEEGIHVAGRVSDTHVMVDVSGAVVSEALIKERKSIGEEGFVLVRVVINKAGQKVLGSPFVETLGWVESQEKPGLIKKISSEVHEAISDALVHGEIDQKKLVRIVRRTTGSFVDSRTGRRPALLPLVEMV